MARSTSARSAPRGDRAAIRKTRQRGGDAGEDCVIATARLAGRACRCQRERILTKSSKEKRVVNGLLLASRERCSDARSQRTPAVGDVQRTGFTSAPEPAAPARRLGHATPSGSRIRSGSRAASASRNPQVRARPTRRISPPSPTSPQAATSGGQRDVESARRERQRDREVGAGLGDPNTLRRRSRTRRARAGRRRAAVEHGQQKGEASRRRCRCWCGARSRSRRARPAPGSPPASAAFPRRSARCTNPVHRRDVRRGTARDGFATRLEPVRSPSAKTPTSCVEPKRFFARAQQPEGVPAVALEVPAPRRPGARARAGPRWRPPWSRAPRAPAPRPGAS